MELLGTEGVYILCLWLRCSSSHGRKRAYGILMHGQTCHAGEEEEGVSMTSTRGRKVDRTQPLTPAGEKMGDETRLSNSLFHTRVRMTISAFRLPERGRYTASRHPVPCTEFPMVSEVCFLGMQV